MPIILHKNLKDQFDWVSSLFDQEWQSNEWQNLDGIPKKPAPVEDMSTHHFNHEMGTEEILKEAKNMGARPASILELLAYAKKYPDEQLKYQIVALGSFTVFYDDRCVAILSRGGAKRNLDRGWFGSRWSASRRFLFVRTNKSSDAFFCPHCGKELSVRVE